MQKTPNSTRMRVNVRDSFWFLPMIYGIFSIISVILMTIADFYLLPLIQDFVPNIVLTNQDIASSLYSALITAILTMTTISFSTIMVVLTTYTTQFSPRTLQDFMKNRFTQHVLGVYSFGFIFALLNLLLLTEDKKKLMASPFFTVVVSIFCLAFFILFIHHSSRFVQVNNLISEIRDRTSGLIRKTYQDKSYKQSGEWSEDALHSIRAGEPFFINSKVTGYIQYIQIGPLIKWAKREDAVIEATFQIGDYIQKGMPLFKLWSRHEVDNDQKCTEYLLIGNERVDSQDLEFSIEKLVEISVKAISPSINDPHTAINCINRIGSLLSELGREFKPYRYFIDADDELRLIMEPRHFEEYLYKSFYQIRIYGSHDISVMNGVLEALYKVALVNGNAVKEDVWRFTEYMQKAIEIDENELDYAYYSKQVDKVKQACSMNS
ncbi:DUF2254 domain-containing protein [Halobacillus sp. ACCC02827]|uniref:DUF2254 domain-containing protein n=1 Tax=Halobacillus sp. ACCC02827 TaxID=3052090 RepID=UPI00256FDBBE|nr:DUF2254 domain-containing protein [Halobacillus sp. ACCC02827]WJE16902.1 DUF2254 domain-containing protein [Halobacillus sp. ACCC02827]